jgi:hypothetical protein
MRDRVTVLDDDGREWEAGDEFWVGIDNGGSFYRIVTEARGEKQAEQLAQGLNKRARQLAIDNQNEVEFVLMSFETGDAAIEVLTAATDHLEIIRYEVRNFFQRASGDRTLESSAIRAIDMATYLHSRNSRAHLQQGATAQPRQPSPR